MQVRAPICSDSDASPLPFSDFSSSSSKMKFRGTMTISLGPDIVVRERGEEANVNPWKLGVKFANADVEIGPGVTIAAAAAAAAARPPAVRDSCE